MRIHLRQFQNKVIILIGIFMLLVYTVAFFVLLDRQKMSRDDILAKSFHDRSLNLLANRLIQARAFSLTEQGTVFLNHSVLTDVVSERYPPGPSWLKRFEDGDRKRAIERDVAFIKKHYEKILIVERGQFRVDPNATKMIFHGQIAGRDMIVRGTIRDRQNRILAESAIGKDRKAYRNYNAMTPALFSIVGIEHPVFGKHFMEKALDPYLLGEKGGIHQKGDLPLSGILRGANVTLTLDAALQEYCYGRMKENHYQGSVVIIEAKTGEIVVAASTPGVDGSKLSNEAWRNMEKNNSHIMLQNKCFSKLYFPGSIFKVAVASAYLESEKKRDDFRVHCNGHIPDQYRIRCTGNHGSIGLVDGFAKSCNQVFSELAVMLGPELGEYARKFGFDYRSTNLLPQLSGLPYDAVPSHGIVRGFDYRNNKGLVAQAGIGQNLIKVTPLQAAMMMTPFANQGNMMAPYLVRGINDANGKVIFQAKPVIKQQVVSPKTAMQVLQLMERVMNQGTAKEVKKIKWDGRHFTTDQTAKGRIVRVAGKTGTAQEGTKGNGQKEAKPHSWFVGIAPADKPEFVIAVVLENQGYGAAAATPLAMDMLTATLNMKNANMKEVAKRY